MKKLTTKFIVILILISSIGINQTYSQLGNLNSLKNKASKIKKKKKKKKDKSSSNSSSSSSSSKTYTVNAYSKYMDDGYKFKEEKKLVEAYTAFSNALKEKPGDYSAKQQVQQTEKEVKYYFGDKIEADIKEAKCEQAEKDLAEAMKVLEVWYQENYYKKEIAKCKENAVANASANENKAKIDALADGTGNFYSDYAKKDFNSTIPVGNDLFVKFKFAKTMMEYSADFGIDETFNAYGYFTIYIDGKKVLTDGPYQFTSNYSKSWKSFDVPLCISPDFLKKLKANPSMLSTNQDVWVLQQVANPTGISSKYTMAAIQNFATNGNHKVKVEFGLGERDEGKPKGTVAVGELTVKVDDAGRKELYKRGPKYLRPLDDNERGKINFSNNSYEVASGDLSITINLPQAPKYYNMKWCQSSSCDYDHGELMFEAELDGKYLASWQTTFWNADYESKKQFTSIILPVNDKDLGNDLSKFNSSDFFKKVGNDNPIVYAIYDLIYANKLSAGKHSLKIKVISPESVPPNLTFEASKKYYDNLTNTIAENTLSFTVSSSTKNKLTASSSARRLKHAGGTWASVDAHLKKSSTDGLATILDVATYTDWKVTVNYLGTPLYRTCKANVLYKSKNGATRLARAVGVKEDYKGSGYGKPYFTDIMNNYYTANPGFLNSMHYPVPYSKVK